MVKTVTRKPAPAASTTKKRGPVASAASTSTTKKTIQKDKPKRKKARKETFSIYIFRILKQVHPETTISKMAMSIMNSFVNDIFERIASEAAKCCQKGKKSTLSSNDIKFACQLVLPGEIEKHAKSEGTKCLAKYNNAKLNQISNE